MSVIELGERGDCSSSRANKCKVAERAVQAGLELLAQAQPEVRRARELLTVLHNLSLLLAGDVGFIAGHQGALGQVGVSEQLTQITLRQVGHARQVGKSLMLNAIDVSDDMDGLVVRLHEFPM